MLHLVHVRSVSAKTGKTVKHADNCRRVRGIPPPSANVCRPVLQQASSILEQATLEAQDR